MKTTFTLFGLALICAVLSVINLTSCTKEKDAWQPITIGKHYNFIHQHGDRWVNGISPTNPLRVLRLTQGVKDPTNGVVQDYPRYDTVDTLGRPWNVCGCDLEKIKGETY